MTEVERLCQDVVILREGRKVAQGTPQALLQRYGRRTLEDVFIHIARKHDESGPPALDAAHVAESKAAAGEPHGEDAP